MPAWARWPDRLGDEAYALFESALLRRVANGRAPLADRLRGLAVHVRDAEAATHAKFVEVVVAREGRQYPMVSR